MITIEESFEVIQKLLGVGFEASFAVEPRDKRSLGAGPGFVGKLKEQSERCRSFAK